jgi:hypothetical protein
MGCPHLLGPLIWEEFLKYRWSTSAKIPFPGLDPIAYAQRTSAFGPDLGAVRRRLWPRTGGLYSFFVAKRHHETGTQAKAGPKETAIRLTREWAALTDAQKAQLDDERKRTMANGP